MSYLSCISKLKLLNYYKNLAVKKTLCSSAFSTVTPDPNEKPQNDQEATKKTFSELAEYRFVFPEFLPKPSFRIRDKLLEKLERTDMLRRRSCIDIPEFYVGSILAVHAADPFAPNKENCFVGICIARSFYGLRATFTLRNIVDGLGIEIMYDMYNPTLHKIEVLRLEKRLDDELYYLRDCPAEYSTFPFDMEPEYVVEGTPVKLNPIIIKVNPLPWTDRWEIKNLKGIDVKDYLDQLPIWRKKTLPKVIEPWAWEKYDIMKQYRKIIPEEDQKEIWDDVDSHQKQFQIKRKSLKKRTLLKATKRSSR